MSRHQADIEEAKRHWLQPLEELIERINRSFGMFFNSMKCVGEVDLNVPENPVSYVSYLPRPSCTKPNTCDVKIFLLKYGKYIDIFC